MKTASGIVNLSIICLLVCHESATLEEGDSCQLNNGSPGVCTLFPKCRSAIKDENQGVLPTACSFNRFFIVVCCEDQLIAGLVAERMCKQYSQYANEKRKAIAMSVKHRIINGGTFASTKEFPHMALIGYQRDVNQRIEWNCGGTLISHNFVLSAAHCLYDITHGFAKWIRVGITDQRDLSYMQQLEVQQHIVFPDYNGTKYHDIALLKLVSDVRMNPYARAACLFTKREIPNTEVIACGWGVTRWTGYPSTRLLKVNLEVIRHGVCNNAFRRVAAEVDSKLGNGIVNNWMVCAGSTLRIGDSCRGDSGSPLQIIREGTYGDEIMYGIIGITSFGKGCGLARSQPGVYTRVSNYISWIVDEGDSGSPFQIIREGTHGDKLMYGIIGITSFGKGCGLAQPGVYTRVSNYISWIVDEEWPNEIEVFK